MHDDRDRDPNDSMAEMVAKGIAAGRVAFGLGCLLAPRKILGPAAKVADGPMVWMARAFGVRDIVLGAGTLAALQGGGANGVQWVRFSAAADSLDIANAVVFRKELDRTGVVATLALAVPAAVGGWWSGAQLDR